MPLIPAYVRGEAYLRAKQGQAARGGRSFGDQSLYFKTVQEKFAASSVLPVPLYAAIAG
jgi:hypothetical protein